jgi:hypothetical protein
MRHSATPAPHTRTPTARLGCEALEARDNPAGNVTAFLSGGQLIVIGDALDNAFSIQQNALRDIIIYGVNGTAINGLPAVYVGRGTLSGLFINSGLGNDLVEVLGVQTPGNVTVWTDFGNDGVHLNGIAANTIGVTTGPGDDIVNEFNLFTNIIGTNLGPGNDAVLASNVNVSVYASFVGGDGSDVFYNRGINGPVFYAGFEVLG